MNTRWMGIAVVGLSTIMCHGGTSVAAPAAEPTPAGQTAKPSWAEAVMETRQILREGLRLGPWYVRSAAADGKEQPEDMLAEFKAAVETGQTSGWRRVAESPDNASLRLEGGEGSCFWLGRTFDMPRSNALAILYSIAANANLEMWLNGRSVSVVKRNAVPLPTRVYRARDSSPGRNFLLLRATDSAQVPTVSFRLADKTNAHWATTAQQALERQWPGLMDDLKRDLHQTQPVAWLVADDWAAQFDAALARVVADCQKYRSELGLEAEAMAEPTAGDIAAGLAQYERLTQQRRRLRTAQLIVQSVTSSGADAAPWRIRVQKLFAGPDEQWQELEAEAAQVKIRSFGIDEVVFAMRKASPDAHWYANFSHTAINTKILVGDGGRLAALNLATGAVRVLLDDPKGGVRDPQVHYDGRKIVFSYRRGNQPYYHLYEIQADGSGLKQLTDGPCDDIEPAWLPDGGIVFCSSRCNRYVNCWNTRVAIIYRCDGDGRNVRALSTNIEQDNTPWVLPDGRILYMRWEYVDRNQIAFHHLWTMNPDGTGQMVYFGNLFHGTVMLGAKPIPGTRKVVASFSPGHGQPEHAGFVTVVDPDNGPDDLTRARRVSNEFSWRDPYPLSESWFLVAGKDTDLRVMDDQGVTLLLYELPQADKANKMSVHEPRPLVQRPREAVLATRTDLARANGSVYLQDVYMGRNMQGVQRGEIKKLLVLETLPKPVNFSGAQEPLSMSGTFTLERILGTVPVEEDGSAYFELPAMRPVFFVALDENDLSVKRMQSFMTVQPGERVSCVGCHENRVEAPRSAQPGFAQARKPSRIEPIAGVPDVFDFPRDIQPILDRNCVACHSYAKTPTGGPRAGGVILTGDRGLWYSHSYVTLTKRGLFSDGRNGSGNRPPRSIGSSASRLLRMVDGTHHEAKLSPAETTMLRLWIESAAPYPGTYAALGSGMVLADLTKEAAWNRRCEDCHGQAKTNEERMVDRELWLNLTRPEQSLALLAPLASAAGGLGLCRRLDAAGNPAGEAADVFANTADPDYQALLKVIAEVKADLDRRTRFDMPDFRPRAEYLREMKFYGILPADWKDSNPIDVYQVERRYWESFWYVPPTGAGSTAEAVTPGKN